MTFATDGTPPQQPKVVNAQIVQSAPAPPSPEQLNPRLPPIVWDGGNPQQRQVVRSALLASAFPWARVLKNPVTVKIGDGLPSSDATSGLVQLDGRLLSTGDRFPWGTILHEFGHEVDYGSLNDEGRQKLQPLLRAAVWQGAPQHNANGQERFADALAAAYWPTPQNTSFRLTRGYGVNLIQFRRLLATILGLG